MYRHAVAQRLLRFAFPCLCHSCGAEISAGGSGARSLYPLLCDACSTAPSPRRVRLSGDLELVTAFRRARSILALVKGWKYAARDATLPFFLDGLDACLAELEALPRPWTFVPVPMPWPRRLKRGFNQSAVLASHLARRHGGCCRSLLRRGALAGHQVGRGRQARLANAQGEFSLRREPPAGGSLILVDDVCTTGATLLACHRALVSSGPRLCTALALLRMPPPGHDPLLTGRKSPEYFAGRTDPIRPRQSLDDEEGVPVFDKLTIRDIDVAGKTVFMRVDYNVPLNDRQEITDDTRIRASLDSIRHLIDGGARLILASHLGRPKGQYVFEMSLAPVADRLAEMVDVPVRFARECIGDEVRGMVGELKEGEILLLENLRFHAEETDNDDDFSAQLASLAEVYVNDAFGTAHRAHASTVGITAHMGTRAAGFLMEKELRYLGGFITDPGRPAVAVLGGAKISGKIPVIENLIERMDKILIGGGMAFTFFKAMGLTVGSSIVDEELLETAKKTVETARERGCEILLPVDVAIAREIKTDAEVETVLPTDIPEGWKGLDIGPETIKLYEEALSDAGSIFWNGPMGVFEVKSFAAGTLGLASAMAMATGRGAVTVVGGGDSVAAIGQLDLVDRFSHVSTGGGASLELMEGKVLPGVDALSDPLGAML